MMNFIKKKWLKSRWIGNPPLPEGELLRKSAQIKDGLVMGMRLAVLEEQAAAVIAEGRLLSVFLPGAYQLEQDKMPPLKPHHKYNWLFPAQLYFLNLAPFAKQPWQPQAPLLMRDPERGLAQLSMAGSYTAQVENATLFMQFMVLQNGFRDWPSLHRHLQARLNDLSVRLTARQSMPLSRLPKMREKFGLSLREELNRDLRGSGLVIKEICVETLELHPSMRRLLEEQQDYLDFNQARLRAIVG